MIGIVAGGRRDITQRPFFDRAPLNYSINYDSPQIVGLKHFYAFGAQSTYVNGGETNLITPALYALGGYGGVSLTHATEGVLFSRVFDGTDDYLATTSGVGVTGVPLSMAVWYRRTGASGYLVNIANSASDTQWFGLYGSGLGALMGTNGGGGASYEGITAGSAWTANEWGLLVGVWRTSTSRTVYQNGAGRKVSGTKNITPTGINHVTIGALGRATMSDYANAQIAHVCIWDRALSEDEVQALYDPYTRWDLYYPLGRKTWSFSPSTFATGHPAMRRWWMGGSRPVEIGRQGAQVI